ncbi:MAG: hypothetical protein JXA25_01940 [Anaerolineales bacterium]|nr:hypothetical protein [Anaerolineales bacterium]
MELYVPPGGSERGPLPLDRFLPPLEPGAVSALLRNQGIQGANLLDVFGSSPRLVAEAAEAGCAVLVSCTNPILRFLIRHTAQPFKKEELQTALTRLGNLPKDDVRLEQYLQELYRSRCEHCGHDIIVDAFLWITPKDVPSYKVYRCERCNFEGETPAGIEDARLMRELSAYRQHREMLLARIAPPGDPYRQSAAEALDIYTPRAQIAIDVLLNKLDQVQFDPLLAPAVRALCLSAMDRCTSLWSYPQSSRPRPKQLSLSPRYYEYNVWQALLWSVDRWSQPETEVEVISWEPGTPLGAGTICLYPGSVRDLVPFLSEMSPHQMVSILPRPNQAFWSLSVLWAIWLFGKEAAQPIKRSLLRHRVDWHWYAGALKSVLSRLEKHLVVEKPALTLILEAEPAFLEAAFAGFQTAGFSSTGFALHEDSLQAISTWIPGYGKSDGRTAETEKSLRAYLIDVLRQRSEPASYAVLAAAALAWLAGSAADPARSGGQAGSLMDSHHQRINTLLEERDIFLRMDQSLELERGLFWLKDNTGTGEPLSDRVEREVARILMEARSFPDDQLVDQVYRLFPAILIPGRKLIRLCAEAYAVFKEGIWHLREEEQPDQREADRVHITTQLWALGQRLGFQVDDTGEVLWLDGQGRQVKSFLVSTQAALGFLLGKQEFTGSNLVVPGSRSGLILDRLRRDPRLKEAMNHGLRILKYRQIRRLSVDPAVERGNFETYLDLDPLEHQDPQIRLL